MSKRNLATFFLGLLLYMPISTYSASPENSVVATIIGGVNPTGMAITRDSSTAYMANLNNYGVAGQYSVSVLNLKNNSVETIIHDPSFSEPYNIALNAEETKAYVTNSNSTTVSVIDTKTNKVTKVIKGFDGPDGIVINHETNLAYITNYGGPNGVKSDNGRTVSVVDLNTNKIVKTITVGYGPVSLAISPDNKFIYVINYEFGKLDNGSMSIIRTDTNKVIHTVRGLFGPFAIALTPDGNFAYITNFGSNDFTPIGSTVSVIDLKKRKPKITATIDLGLQPSGIDITPNGLFAYVSNYNTLYRHADTFVDLTPGGGTVQIIDIATNQVLLPTIAVGNSPGRVYISPDGKFAYTTNFSGNTLSVIALP